MSPRALLRSKKGTTLVELMVCAALLAILLAALSGLIGPVTGSFLRMQSMNHAQSVVDTVLDHLRGQVLEAQGYVKLYEPTAQAGDFPGTGAASLEAGTALEFLSRDGYAVLVDAGGCGDTTIIKNKDLTDSHYSFPAGYLLMRYYRTGGSGQDLGYTYRMGSRLVARGVSQVYGQRFYMGDTLGLEFRFPPDTREGDQVPWLEVTATVYREGEPLYRDTAVLDLVFRPTARLAATARAQEP